MKKSHLLGAACACITVVSFNASAIIINHGALTTNDNGSSSIITDTLNNYEWLRLDILAPLTYAETVNVLDTQEGGGWSIAGHAQALQFVDAVFAPIPNGCLPTDIGTHGCGIFADGWDDGDFGDNHGLVIDTAWFMSNGDMEVGLIEIREDNTLNMNPSVTSIAESDEYSSSGSVNSSPITWLLYRPIEAPPTSPVDLVGTVKTSDGTDICALVLANGQYMFSCNPVGVFSLTELPRELDGTVKRQIYADGFFPKVDIQSDSTDETVVMMHSGTCPNYNVPYDAGVFPDSAGKNIDIAGRVQQLSLRPICALVLANGQPEFSCDETGSYALNIPLGKNGQFKLQVYAQGFAPTIQTFDEFQTMNDVVMTRAGECQ